MNLTGKCGEYSVRQFVVSEVTIVDNRSTDDGHVRGGRSKQQIQVDVDATRYLRHLSAACSTIAPSAALVPGINPPIRYNIVPIVRSTLEPPLIQPAKIVGIFLARFEAVLSFQISK